MSWTLCLSGRECWPSTQSSLCKRLSRLCSASSIRSPSPSVALFQVSQVCMRGDPRWLRPVWVLAARRRCGGREDLGTLRLSHLQHWRRPHLQMRRQVVASSRRPCPATSLPRSASSVISARAVLQTERPGSPVPQTSPLTRRCRRPDAGHHRMMVGACTCPSPCRTSRRCPWACPSLWASWPTFWLALARARQGERAARGSPRRSAGRSRSTAPQPCSTLPLRMAITLQPTCSIGLWHSGARTV
mmetsp:Transcript_39596/g.86294  ORF Transcript_39596/g.86294 Transcript_39596/m.86294 type:complete len:245 (-) Transcript_39596:344-1078(-)